MIYPNLYVRVYSFVMTKEKNKYTYIHNIIWKKPITLFIRVHSEQHILDRLLHHRVVTSVSRYKDSGQLCMITE